MTTYYPNSEEYTVDFQTLQPTSYQASAEEARGMVAQAEYAERQINELRNQDWS